MPELPACGSLLLELEAQLASGSVQHRLKILQRVTDLFVAGSHRYSGAEVDLFDDVLISLTAEVEEAARAALAQRLAPMVNAPPRLIRRLAFDDAILVAAPVLVSSPRLTDADLIENAATKSQEHLYAIAQRIELSEGVTDVLVRRGDRRVVRRVARNNGAKFSFASYDRMVRYARDDGKLALTIGRRRDLPRQCFIKLLETASAEVRLRLEAMNPQAAAEIRATVAEVAGTIQRAARETSRRHAQAMRYARKLARTHRLSEANVHAAARSEQFAKAAVALSILGQFPIELVERALLDKCTETVLVLAKAAGCSWTTAKALLLMRSAGRGLSQQDITQAAEAFDRLNRETAKRVVKFYERRNGRDPEEATAPEADLDDDAAMPEEIDDELQATV